MIIQNASYNTNIFYYTNEEIFTYKVQSVPATLNRYSDVECLERYRFRKRDLELLFGQIEHKFSLATSKLNSVEPFHQILIALRYYSTGSFQLTASDLLWCLQPTVSRIIARLSDALASLSRDYIQFPASDQFESTQDKFYDIASFPELSEQ